jgi:hypothetical protein
LCCVLVDGVFLDWSEWGTCSVTCAGGFRSRERSCDGPYHGGSNCTGDWRETQGCNTLNCPGKAWSATTSTYRL